MTPKLPIVFFGSGPVAAASLKLLNNSGKFLIEAVVTKPRPAGHKGPVPVLDLATDLGFQTVLAANKAELSAVVAQSNFSSQVAVLIDFGIIVNQDVIDKFPLGIVNSHFSLLPEWRGADPISFAILSGQKTTGVSLMLLVEAMDEGPLIGQQAIGVDGADIETLTNRLINLSADMLTRYLPKYVDGSIKPSPQKGEPSYSRKLTKADGELDFSKPASQLEREVRAYKTWPKCHTRISDLDVLVVEANVIEGSGEAGKIYKQSKKLGFYTTNGIFIIERLKPAGKAEMTAEAFVAGYGQKLGL